MILLTYGASFTILWGLDAAVEAIEEVLIINLKFINILLIWIILKKSLINYS